MDWPGHGLSSKRPYLYNTFEYVSDIRYAADGMHFCISLYFVMNFALLKHLNGKVLVF